MDYINWRDDEQALAIRLPATEAKRFLQCKELVVPEDCVCLLEGEERALLPAGGRRSSISDLSLLKESLFTIETNTNDLSSQDGHTFECHARFTAYIDTRSQDQAERFRRVFLSREADDCTLVDVVAAVLPKLKSALSAFVTQREALTLDDEGIDEELERHLRTSLKGFFEDAGLEMSRVRSARFQCETLEKLKRNKAEAEAIQKQAEIDHGMKEFLDDLERQGRLNELNKKEELQRAYQEFDERRQRELQEQRHKLREAEQDHQRELEQKKFEEELQRRKKAIEMLRNANIAEILEEIPDEQEREKVYKGLISNLVTPSRETTGRVSRKLEEMQQQLMEAASKMVQQGSGRFASLRPRAEDSDARTHRVLIASGRRVLAFDPKSNVQAEQAREIYDFSAGELGGIRSVRVVRHDGKKYVAAGARGGVYVTPLRGPTDPASGELTTYRFASEPAGRTGVNAIELIGNRLVVTHSEVGLVCWEFGNPQVPSQTLFPETTANAKSVRALTAQNGEIYYSSGNRVYRADLASEHPVPLLYSGSTSQVTSLALQDGRLYGATVDGAIYAWEPDDPHSPTRVLHRQAKIYMIRPATIGCLPHLFIGSKDRGVLCRYMAGGMDSTYQSGSLVRWADGAADFCFGVDYDSYQLIIWRSDLPDSELRRIPLAEPINDLWIDYKEPRV